MVVVLSSDAVSADAGYRSPRGKAGTGPAIGEEQVSAARTAESWFCPVTSTVPGSPGRGTAASSGRGWECAQRVLGSAPAAAADAAER